MASPFRRCCDSPAQSGSRHIPGCRFYPTNDATDRALAALLDIESEIPSEIVSSAPHSDDKRLEVVRHQIDQNNAQRASQELRRQIESDPEFGCF